ncbi:MAG: ribonuclease M5 [Firmicutes bacterium]|nr:ribonuclease M5 [Clostridiales bacterium]MBQ9930825.1 ribonuclease M5 [Bacillota bacterium]
MIREIIVVEGRDDERAVRAAVDAEIIATHGFGISAATFSRIEKAAESRGIIIFTDPDHAGEQIRKRLEKRFPDAKHAFLPREEAEKAGDIGIENASPESIREALGKARASVLQDAAEFTQADLYRYGLAGEEGSAERRDKLGKALGIGYGNAGTFLRRLNHYGITREEFEKHGQALFPYSG